MRLRRLGALPSLVRLGRSAGNPDKRPLGPLEQLVRGPDGLAAQLFDLPGLALLAIDRQGRILRANQATQSLLQAAGVSADLSPGAPVLDLFAAGERDAVWGELSAALQIRPGRAPFATLLASPDRVVSDDGAAAAGVGLSAWTLRNAQGMAGGVLLRLHDLSAQRQLETQLAQAQKLQALGQLTGGMAHDFNNLLTAVLNAAESLAGTADLSPEAAEDVAQIRASASRGAALVRQLLAFSRQQTLQPRPLALNQVVTDLSGLLRRLLGTTVRLELALEEPGCTVRADPTQLDQVLVNLAVNARDAMPHGGTLTLRTGHVTLHRGQTIGAESVPPGRYATVDVVDTGQGIPPDILPRIFDPFFTTRRSQGGTGLGLSTVHGIVRQSDGFLEVTSEPGRGTSMRVHLPRWEEADAMRIPVPPMAASPAASGSVGPGPGPQRPAGAPPRGAVLLVDDEDGVRRLAARALTRAGWQVLSVASGEAARAALEASSERLAGIVTDLAMHGMDGVAVVQAVRLHTGQPRLPALLVSGYAETALRTALGGIDHVSFLAKPYELSELTEAFAALVDQTPGTQTMA